MAGKFLWCFIKTSSDITLYLKLRSWLVVPGSVSAQTSGKVPTSHQTFCSLALSPLTGCLDISQIHHEMSRNITKDVLLPQTWLENVISFRKVQRFHPSKMLKRRLVQRSWLAASGFIAPQTSGNVLTSRQTNPVSISAIKEQPSSDSTPHLHLRTKTAYIQYL